ncbi:MAG TPA: phage holin family protein [Candidatus Binatia bacterium]|jgi:putative membrane protein|nr:phage holin family protein [Candidatus Binatia bacterium]
MRLLLNWLLSAVALLVVSFLVPGFHVEGFKSALIAAVVIGLINATLGLLLKLITLPLTILTLGVFWWIVNALMLMLASALLTPGFRVEGFLWAFLGAIVLSLVNVILRKLASEVTD